MFYCRALTYISLFSHKRWAENIIDMYNNTQSDWSMLCLNISLPFECLKVTTEVVSWYDFVIAVSYAGLFIDQWRKIVGTSSLCDGLATADPMSILWRSRSPVTVSRLNGSIYFDVFIRYQRQQFKTTLLCVKER